LKHKYGRMLGSTATVAALLVSMAACTSEEGGGSSDSASEDGCGLEIGFFGAYTGENANLGIAIYRGAELAINQYNEEHPDCQVEYVIFDSGGSEETAPGLAQEAVAHENLIGVIGPAFSGESSAANPIFEEAGVPLITASATNPDLANQGWTVWHRLLGNDASQGPAAARYIQNVLQAQAVFVIDDTTTYGEGLANEVRDTLGDLVVGNSTIQPGQADFSAVITQLQASGADTVFFGGYYAEAGPFVRQLRAAGSQATFVAADGVRDPAFIEGAGPEAAEGAILTCPCIPPSEAEGTFYEDYQEAYGEDPGTYGPEAYDAATIFLAGIEAGATTREEMNEFIDNYEGQGVTKQIRFQENGELDESVIEIWAYRVENGQIVQDQVIPAE